MNNGLYVIIGVIVGWLLSLLSPRIIEGIQNHYRRKSLRCSLMKELEEIRYKLALVSHSLFAGSGPEIRKFIEWLIPVLRSYHGVYLEDVLADKLTDFLKYSDEQLSILPEYTSLSKRAINLKK